MRKPIIFVLLAMISTITVMIPAPSFQKPTPSMPLATSRSTMAGRGKKPDTLIAGGGNFISNHPSTAGVKCKFGFMVVERYGVWTGHGAFNGRKLTIDNCIDYGIGDTDQTYYNFSGIIGIRYKEPFMMYVEEHPDGSDDIEFQIRLDKYPLIYHGTNINGQIVIHKFIE